MWVLISSPDCLTKETIKLKPTVASPTNIIISKKIVESLKKKTFMIITEIIDNLKNSKKIKKIIKCTFLQKYNKININITNKKTLSWTSFKDTKFKKIIKTIKNITLIFY